MNTFIRVHALCDVRVTLKDQLWLGRLGVLARVAIGLLEHIPAVQVGRITVREDDVAVLCERRGITHREAYGETHMERKKENTRMLEFIIIIIILCRPFHRPFHRHENTFHTFIRPVCGRVWAENLRESDTAATTVSMRIQCPS